MMLSQLYRVFFVNARCIINKMDEFESNVYSHKPDLTMITESWAREGISNTDISVDDFAIFRNDRKISVGGGCILYIRNCHNANMLEELTNVPNTEAVWFKLILSKMSILIGVCYDATSATTVNEIALHNTIRKAGSIRTWRHVD